MRGSRPASTTRPVPDGPTPAPPSWATAVAGLAEGAVLLDLEGRVLDMNPAAEALLDVAVAQATTRRLSDLLLPPGRGWLGTLIATTLREGVTLRHGEGILQRPAGPTPVAVTCAPTHDEAGGRAGAVLLLHDMTLERSLDEGSRRTERLAALGAVAQGLAHEIRNPLGGIKGAAQLLRTSLTEPEDVACVDVIVREVDRLNGLVEHLRTLGVPPRLELKPVNIHHVLSDVLLLQQQAPEWGAIDLALEFDPSLPAVHGDAGQLTQVFLNLVRNAVEALQGRGRLVVSTRLETRFHVRLSAGRRRYLTVVVADDGPGVSAECRDRLFSPFFTTKPRGTGLGLAACHRIVAEHGGTIAYEPRPGGGSIFRVRLPILETHEQLPT